MSSLARTHAVTEELSPGTRSIIKVDDAFMRAVLANPTMRNNVQRFKKTQELQSEKNISPINCNIRGHAMLICR